MSSEIATVTREFNGAEVTFLEREEGMLWMTAEQLGICLGYACGRESASVNKLAAAHIDEIAPHRSRTKLVQEAGAREVAIYNEHAQVLLACWADTEKAKAFRAWLAQTVHDLRTKDKLLIDREEWERTRDASVMLLHAYETQAAAMGKIASLAGHILSLRRHTKPKEDPRQRLFRGVRFEEIATEEAVAEIAS